MECETCGFNEKERWELNDNKLECPRCGAEHEPPRIGDKQ